MTTNQEHIEQNTGIISAEDGSSVEPQMQEQQEQPSTLSIEELLSSNGYGDELKIIQQHKMNVEKEESANDQPFRDTEEFASLVKFASENKMATLDDFKQYDILKEKKDVELAFESFKENYEKDEFEEDLDNEDLEELQRNKFNELYFIDNGNEELENFGKSKIEKIAQEKREKYTEKINSVRDFMVASKMFEEHKKIANELKEEKQLREFVIKNEFDEDVKIDLQVGNENIDFANIEKELKTTEQGKVILNNLFELYKVDNKKSNEIFKNYIMEIQDKRNEEDRIRTAISKAYNEGVDRGKKLGIGFSAPFQSSTAQKNIQGGKVNQYKGDY